MTPDFWLHLAMAVGAALGVYGAVRADLARALVEAEHASKAAAHAHARMDRHIETAH